MQIAQFRYKCRLCGEIEENPRMPILQALAEILKTTTGDTSTEVGLVRLHLCKDSNVGVCDLLGYKVYEEA